jgi:hypothetical protein
MGKELGKHRLPGADFINGLETSRAYGSLGRILSFWCTGP